MLIGRELVLGLWLALESSAGEIERLRLRLRDAERCEACDQADIALAKVWLRLENARRALDAAGVRAE